MLFKIKLADFVESFVKKQKNLFGLNRQIH